MYIHIYTKQTSRSRQVGAHMCVRGSFAPINCMLAKGSFPDSLA